jgi:AcrR family transcriptional regulator
MSRSTSQKKDAILSTAERLFARFGAGRITVKEICETAQVSKMTFYKYFRNKQAVIAAVRDAWIERTFQAFDDINQKEIPFPQKIDMMTRWKMDFLRNTDQEFIREISRHDEVYEAIKAGYLKNIRTAREKGEIRNDIDPEFYWMVVSKISEIYRDGSWKRVFSDAAEYQRQLRTLLFYGLVKR